MCKFFSAVSNGKGKILHFTLEQIQDVQKQGNPENYNWNSHTSIMYFNNIKGDKEDNWNKWEYDCEKKELVLDGELNTKQDDRESVKKVVEKYLADNNAIYIEKVFKNNSGHSNSGYSNSGDSNSGYSNSGYSNSGYRNSGYSNSGHWNSGDRNSGFLNTDTPNVRIFNKETKVKREDINFPSYFYFDVIEYKSKDVGCELIVIKYKEAFIKSFNENCDKEQAQMTLKLPNFKYNLFEEISGITKKMIQDKLKGE